MQRIKESVDRALERVLVVLMSAMVVNVLWQVFSRFILRDPSTFTDELARFLLLWLGVLGASYVVGRKRHLAIDLVINKMDASKRRLFEIFIEVAIFFFALSVMVVGGINLVSLTLYLDQTSAALQVKQGYVYIVIPVAGLLCMFYAVMSVLESVRARPA